MSDSGIIKESQEALLRALTTQLRRFGFAPRVAQQDYTRDDGRGRWVIHVGFVRHKADVDATLDLGVLLVPVERLLQRAGFGGKGGATLGAELGNIVDGRPRRWTIRGPQEAASVAQEMSVEISAFGLDWLRRFSDLKTVYEILAPNDRLSWLYSPLHVKRCLVLVAIARLLESREAAERVAQECRSFLLARNDPQVGVYDDHARRVLTA